MKHVLACLGGSPIDVCWSKVVQPFEEGFKGRIHTKLEVGEYEFASSHCEDPNCYACGYISVFLLRRNAGLD